MDDFKPMHAEKEGAMEIKRDMERNDTAIDHDRGTFLPRPSDDPNDPLNFPMYLKVQSTWFPI